MGVSIISVAFGEYVKFVDSFVAASQNFTDDIIIASDIKTPHTFKCRKKSMGYMRNEAIKRCKYKYIINLDIDDTLLRLPTVRADFVGLAWIEGSEIKNYWLPGEQRAPDNTIRSNFMFKKGDIFFRDEDNYTYPFIVDLIRSNKVFAKDTKPCVRYNKRQNSRSQKVSQSQEARNKKLLKELERTAREHCTSVDCL